LNETNCEEFIKFVAVFGCIFYNIGLVVFWIASWAY